MGYGLWAMGFGFGLGPNFGRIGIGRRASVESADDRRFRSCAAAKLDVRDGGRVQFGICLTSRGKTGNTFGPTVLLRRIFLGGEGRVGSPAYNGR